MGEAGIEPENVTPSKAKDLRKSEITSAAKSGAVQSSLGEVVAEDSDLEYLAKAWGRLPKRAREAIRTIIDYCKDAEAAE